MDYSEQLFKLIRNALEEDIGEGDHSTQCCVPSGAPGKAVLKIKENGVLAGITVAEQVFRQLSPNVVFKPFKQDGDIMHAGEEAFEVEAEAAIILKAERLVLNCMQRMSGIATLTRSFVRQLEGTKAQLLDTRKTTPNFRLLEKEAVKIGGGRNHRFGLFDMIMLKDNHIDFCGSIENAIDKAHQYVQNRKPQLRIEIETRNLSELERVLAVGKGKVHRVMLDNFNTVDLARAVKMVNRAFETEASGGINLDNIRSYAETGVDYISSGALIHQARSLDLSLKAVTVKS